MFFEHTATLFDYLPNDALLVTFGDIQGTLEKLWIDINHRYEQRRYDQQKPLLHPNEIFMLAEQVHSRFKQMRRIRAAIPSGKPTPGAVSFNTAPVTDIAAEHQNKQPFAKLKELISTAIDQGQRLLFVTESAGRKEALHDILGRIGYPAPSVAHFSDFEQSNEPLALTVGPVINSVHLKSENIYLITETELMGNRVSQRRRREQKPTQSSDALIRNLAELKIGSREN